MNPLTSNLSRDLTCGAAAVLITTILGATFVESTAVAPGSRVEARHVLTLQLTHGWFGEPEPAVLVD